MPNETRKRLNWTFLYTNLCVLLPQAYFQKNVVTIYLNYPSPFFLKFISLEQSQQHFEKASFCSGGDNNPGLLVLPIEQKEHQFTVKDSIIGRPSQGFITKVHTWTKLTNYTTTQQFFQILEVAFSLASKNTNNLTSSKCDFEKTHIYDLKELCHGVGQNSNRRNFHQTEWNIQITAQNIQKRYNQHSE